MSEWINIFDIQDCIGSTESYANVDLTQRPTKQFIWIAS